MERSAADAQDERRCVISLSYSMRAAVPLFLPAVVEI